MMMLLISDCLVSTQREKREEKREKREERRKKERSNLSLSLFLPFFFFFSSPVPRRGACGATKVLSFLN